MREKILFVYNPNAGKKKIQEKLNEVVNLLTQGERELIISPTKQRKDAQNAVMEYVKEGRCEKIVVSGGDGTLHEVINGMMQCERRVPIVYIPAGSTNDFGYSLNISKDITEAVRLANEGIPFECDVAQFNDEFFVYTAAFGLFTDVSYATPQSMKNIFGHAAYVLNGASSLAKIKRFSMAVSYDGLYVEDNFIYGMVVSSESIGGFRGITGPDVKLNDGEYELFLVRDCKAYELPELVNDILHGKFDNKNIIYKRVKEVYFSSPSPVAWTLDGEFGGEFTTVHVTVHKKAVTFMTPKNLVSIVEGDML